MKYLTLCYWLTHKYDEEKYRKDLREYWSLRKPNLMDRTAIEAYYDEDNQPKPYCLRCKKEIRI